MFVCLYVINRPRSVRMRPRATRKRSRPCLFRSLRSPTNALHSPSIYVINRPRSVRMRPRATRKRSRPCLFRSLRSARPHSPSMSSTDRGQCACVTAQRANVAGLASSGRCARPQMLCILLVCMYVCMFICHQPTAVSAHASLRNAQT